MTNPTSFVAVLMGSDSDLPVMQATLDVLTQLGVAHEVRITSAHRTPDATRAYVQEADQRGCDVFIAAAGMAAHLAGAVAAHTLKPVLGVPLDASSLQGMDALLSTVQMPGGIPVGCLAVGKAGAKNAGYLAAQILSINDPVLAQKLRADRAKTADEVIRKNAELQTKLAV
ncbi:MAG: 5-(carboxyamino)imidazole ribonucleotide mutase [Methylococcaceae bacterium]|nr:MAG: 5-(carboxyamino)imidazole ribonucleotide mutase [Methylococcaceae bacterium]